MEYRTVKQNPWTWGFPEQRRVISAQQQRCAEYIKTSDPKPDAKFNIIGTFFSQEMPPTPQVAHVCGIQCPGCECGNNNGESGDGNGG